MASSTSPKGLDLPTPVACTTGVLLDFEDLPAGNSYTLDLAP